jgi:hypothetical protein
MQPSVARRMWQVMEPCHAMIYFAPEAAEEYKAAGLRGQWMGYFASRSGPMGRVCADVVVATFHNFHPRLVHRAIPDAWSFATPEHVLEARYRAADGALRRLLGDAVAGAAVVEAASLARDATQACDPAGRALFAGHRSLPWPEPAHLVLWHAITLLREFRFDGHVAALLSEGVDGCEANVTNAATGNVSADLLKAMRAYTDEEWAAGEQRLRVRGWLDGAGAFTDEGRAARQAIEDRTDALAMAPWRHLGADGCRRLEELMLPLTDRVADAGFVFPNPMGLQRVKA